MGYNNIQNVLTNFLSFLNETIVPFLFAFAFLIFIWNAARYFIIGGANPDDQEKARGLAMWGVAAFVIIISLWGIVNMVVAGFGLGDRTPPIPDYMQEKKYGPADFDAGYRSSIQGEQEEPNTPAYSDNDTGYQNPAQTEQEEPNTPSTPRTPTFNSPIPE
jgi:hypothetical protein